MMPFHMLFPSDMGESGLNGPADVALEEDSISCCLCCEFFREDDVEEEEAAI